MSHASHEMNSAAFDNSYPAQAVTSICEPTSSANDHVQVLNVLRDEQMSTDVQEVQLSRSNQEMDTILLSCLILILRSYAII